MMRDSVSEEGGRNKREGKVEETKSNIFSSELVCERVIVR